MGNFKSKILKKNPLIIKANVTEKAVTLCQADNFHICRKCLRKTLCVRQTSSRMHNLSNFFQQQVNQVGLQQLAVE
jgi:hypothetical protein